MGFLKGSVTFQRFRVAGPRPLLFGAEHLDRLRSHRAGRQRLASADGIETGWAAGSHALDTDFTELKNVYPDHLLSDFWTQTDRLPADRLKAYYEADLKALAGGNPSGLPSARQRREAKESARDRLEKEARDGRWRKWKCVPVAWDAAAGAAFFGSTSAAAADRFCELWGRTFGSDLTADPPRALAGDLTPVTAASAALAVSPDAAGERLSEFVAGSAPEDGPAWCPAAEPLWLGNEFLLWLWYYAEQQGDTLSLPDGTEAAFMFSGGVKVEDPRGQTGSGTMNSASAVRLPEAKAAVRAGKLPRKAALTVVRHGDQFSFVLQAETLAVTAAKLPPPGDEADQRARETARLQHLRDLAEVVDLMLGAFLRVRLSPGWADELAAVRGWLRGGRAARGVA